MKKLTNFLLSDAAFLIFISCGAVYFIIGFATYFNKY